MGGGKHFKIRPPDKEDAFPHGVSTTCGEATATVAVYRMSAPNGIGRMTHLLARRDAFQRQAEESIGKPNRGGLFLTQPGY